MNFNIQKKYCCFNLINLLTYLLAAPHGFTRLGKENKTIYLKSVETFSSFSKSNLRPSIKILIEACGDKFFMQYINAKSAQLIRY